MSVSSGAGSREAGGAFARCRPLRDKLIAGWHEKVSSRFHVFRTSFHILSLRFLRARRRLPCLRRLQVRRRRSAEPLLRPGLREDRVDLRGQARLARVQPDVARRILAGEFRLQRARRGWSAFMSERSCGRVEAKGLLRAAVIVRPPRGASSSKPHAMPVRRPRRGVWAAHCTAMAHAAAPCWCAHDPAGARSGWGRWSAWPAERLVTRPARHVPLRSSTDAAAPPRPDARAGAARASRR
jgi:hypothetical protein